MSKVRVSCDKAGLHKTDHSICCRKLFFTYINNITPTRIFRNANITHKITFNPKPIPIHRSLRKAMQRSTIRPIYLRQRLTIYRVRNDCLFSQAHSIYAAFAYFSIYLHRTSLSIILSSFSGFVLHITRIFPKNK